MSTVLVTGATDGLGRALATRLAREGATVIAHARSEERGREALSDLLDGPGDVRLVVGDLASLSAGRALADQVPDRLDVLVNNAGIGFAEGREESADGYELRFAVNYLAGFLLASLLRDRLGPAARPTRRFGARADRQRRLLRPAGHRLRRRHARARLRRRARLPPEQARADHARLRPGRGAGRQRRHRHGAAPGDLHGHEDGHRRRRNAGQHSAGGPRGDLAPGRRPVGRGRHRRLLQRDERGPRRRAGLRPRRPPPPARAVAAPRRGLITPATQRRYEPLLSGTLPA